MVSVQTCPTARLLRPQVGRTRRFQNFPFIRRLLRTEVDTFMSQLHWFLPEAAADGGVDDDDDDDDDDDEMIVLLTVLLMLLLVLLSLLSLLVEVAVLV